MGKARQIGFFIVRRTTLYLAIKVLFTMFVLVYAATIVATPTTYEASIGGAVSVTNNLKAMDKGFSKAGSTISSAGNCPTSNVTFASGPALTANNQINTDHIVFTVQVNTTASTPLVSCFTVTLTLTPNGGPLTTYTVKLASGTSVSADWSIDCKFDIGSALPTSPYSFRVTVQ